MFAYEVFFSHLNIPLLTFDILTFWHFELFCAKVFLCFRHATCVAILRYLCFCNAICVAILRYLRFCEINEPGKLLRSSTIGRKRNKRFGEKRKTHYLCTVFQGTEEIKTEKNIQQWKLKQQHTRPPGSRPMVADWAANLLPRGSISTKERRLQSNNSTIVPCRQVNAM